MARIFYYSCHEILEYDDLRMLTSAGHTVFSTGAFSDPHGSGNFRSPEALFHYGSDYADFVKSGGISWKGRYGNINPDFARRFDVAIVNHVPEWVPQALSSFGDRRVIYRTLGQCTPNTEREVSAYRDNIYVVRYSAFEASLRGFMKSDEIIYFGKVLEDFGMPWRDGTSVLTFHNDYEHRSVSTVPSYGDYLQLVGELPLDLWGRGNETSPNYRGFASPKEQMELYCQASLYLYVPTTAPSYSLSLMEAMLSGTPVVAPSSKMVVNSYSDEILDRYALPHRYEIPAMLDMQKDILFDSVDDARDKISRLLSDPARRSHLSRLVRDKAEAMFDSRKIARQWSELIDTVVEQGGPRP